MARLPMHIQFAGLDYPGIGPEHSWLHDTGGVNYVAPPMMKPWSLFSYAPAKKALFLPRTIACACLCQHYDW